MLRSGFFNSQNHDRMYNATDFNDLISTIKSDGIDNYGDKLEVSAGQGLSVLVSTGKCFFNNHWLYNDNAYQIELEEASVVAPRIDAIVVEVNDTERDVFLKSVSGEPSNNPAPPTLVDSGSVHQHLLAYANVPKEATSVGTITDKRSEWADVKSDKLDDVQGQITSNIENEETASRTLNAGEYIIRNNQLYRVTTTIASGSAITEGTNIVGTTIGGELYHDYWNVESVAPQDHGWAYSNWSCTKYTSKNLIILSCRFWLISPGAYNTEALIIPNLNISSHYSYDVVIKTVSSQNKGKTMQVKFKTNSTVTLMVPTAQQFTEDWVNFEFVVPVKYN